MSDEAAPGGYKYGIALPAVAQSQYSNEFIGHISSGLTNGAGWAAISAKDGVLAEAMVVGVSANGSEKFAVTSKQKREDVAKYFNNPALIDSGFSVYVRKADIFSESKVILYQVFQGGVYACEVTAAL